MLPDKHSTPVDSEIKPKAERPKGHKSPLGLFYVEEPYCTKNCPSRPFV
jgi:hypothetical protein